MADRLCAAHALELAASRRLVLVAELFGALIVGIVEFRTTETDHRCILLHCRMRDVRNGKKEGAYNRVENQ